MYKEKTKRVTPTKHYILFCVFKPNLCWSPASHFHGTGMLTVLVVLLFPHAREQSI